MPRFKPVSSDDIDLPSELTNIALLVVLGLAFLPFSPSFAMVVCLGGLIAYAVWLAFTSRPTESHDLWDT